MDDREISDDYVTRREADVLFASVAVGRESAFVAHAAEHEAEQKAIVLAIEATKREWLLHQDAHDREHVLHSEKHVAENKAVAVALDAVARERIIHADAHEREHSSHAKIHELNQVAVGKAETSVEERLKAMNEFRGQLKDQQGTFVSRETVEALAKEIDRRFIDQNAAMLNHIQVAEKTAQEKFEANRAAITVLEKGVSEGRGKGMGQSSVAAYIVTGVTLVVGILGVTIVIANFLTTH